jgi:Bacteriophage Lambda NinG protein
VAELKKHRATVKELDALCRELTRRRYGGMCALCGRVGNQPHHFFPKGEHAILRWVLDNLVWLCFGCHIRKVHQGGETEPVRDVIIARMGQEAFDEMKELSKQTKRWRQWELNEVYKILTMIAGEYEP